MPPKPLVIVIALDFSKRQKQERLTGKPGRAEPMTIIVHFSPDHEHILSATQSDAVLIADWYEYHESTVGLVADGKCIVRLSRDLYFQALSRWLDLKASYNYDSEFAGAGHITLEELTLLPESGYLSAHMVERQPEDLDVDSDEGIEFFMRKVPVPEFRATAFQVEIEHG
jgi:hypothetical protein